MKLHIVSTIEQLRQLREGWNRLAGEIPMRSWEWCFTWAETMLGEGKLCVIVGKNDQHEIVGIAPFYIQATWTRGNVLRLIGDQRCCTDYPSFLVAPQCASDFVKSVTNWLTKKHHTLSHASETESIFPAELIDWDLMKLEAVETGDSVIEQFCEEISLRKCQVATAHNYSSWQVHYDGCWDDYVDRLSKSQRRNVRRVENRVLQAPEFCTYIADDQRSFEKGMKWFRQLHQKRWQAAGKPGCFSFPEFADFLDTVAVRLFENNSLQILWIEHAGTPVAVDFSFLSDSMIFGYQMGVDPDYRKLELGRALNVSVLKSAIESGRVTFDFLRGDESYKSRWCAEETKLLDIEIVPERIFAQLRQNLTTFGRQVKKSLLLRNQQP